MIRVTSPENPPSSRTALRMMVSKTGCASVGEVETALRISLVAVCCSRDSVTWAWATVSARFFSSSSFEQAHVLDRDHGVSGEDFEQSDLIGSEQIGRAHV